MAGLSAGDLRDRITFQRQAARAVAGTQVLKAGTAEWEDGPTVWAQVQEVLPSRADKLDDGFTIANRPVRIRMRHRTDISGEMRIKFRERVLAIVSGPAVMGNREGLELMAEDYSTQGEQP